MKKNLIVLGLLCLFYSCSNYKINLCISPKTQDEIFSFIIPVNEGNKWVYRCTRKNDTVNVTFSILGLEEIFYNDSTGKKSIKAYKIQNDLNIGISKDFKDLEYYYKCDNAVQMLTVNNIKSKIVKSIYTVLEQPPVYYGDYKLNDSITTYSHFVVWKEPETITVPAGEFSCYVRETVSSYDIVDNDRLKVFRQKYVSSQMFYCKGVGLVKAINYNRDLKISINYELESYVVK